MILFSKKKFLNIKKLKKFYLFIITNQSGIARGFYKEKDFYLLHNQLKEKFINKNIFLMMLFFVLTTLKEKLSNIKKNAYVENPVTKC